MSYNDPYLQFSADNTARTFKFNHDEAKLARDFTKEMSSTSHQMEVNDLQQAGLNPVLSANGGASAYSASSASGQADSAGISAKAQIASALISADAQKYSADASRDSSMFGLLGQYIEEAGLDPKDVGRIIKEQGAIGLIDALSGKALGSSPGTSAKTLLEHLSPAFSRSGLGKFLGSKIEKFGNFFGQGGYNDKGTEWNKLSASSKAEWLQKGHSPWEYNQGRQLSKFKKNNPYMWYVGGKNGLVPFIDHYADNKARGVSARANRSLNRGVNASTRKMLRHASRLGK